MLPARRAPRHDAATRHYACASARIMRMMRAFCAAAARARAGMRAILCARCAARHDTFTIRAAASARAFAVRGMRRREKRMNIRRLRARQQPLSLRSAQQWFSFSPEFCCFRFLQDFIFTPPRAAQAYAAAFAAARH